MSIQINGTDIIDNNKSIKNLGGVSSGVISGSISVPNNQTKGIYISNLSGFRGVAYHMGWTDDPDAATFAKGIDAYRPFVSWYGPFDAISNGSMTLNI